MKAVLKFNLEDAEDRMAHLRCIKSTSMALVLFDVIYNFRKKAENAPLEDGRTELDYFYDLFFAELDAQGINIDELID